MSHRRLDPELGWVKACSACGEDWPVDDEFYWFQNRRLSDGTIVRQPHSLCRACWLERYRTVVA